jgi:hypothetical protein
MSLTAFALAAVILTCECAANAQTLKPIKAADLCVTNGAITDASDGNLHVETPSSRAILRYGTAQSAEIQFRYLGPTAGSKPLASGELRRQIGIKLRAQDSCNLVYIMWHIEPDTTIAVSIKRNPGLSTHEQCGAHGYVNLQPTQQVNAHPVGIGEDHTLYAELSGSQLNVLADGRAAWSGRLPEIVSEFDGPVGVRTDNARFNFSYSSRAAVASSVHIACAKAPGD